MPRKNNNISQPKQGDNQPVKDYDYNVSQDTKTLKVFALQAQGGIGGVIKGNENLFNYLNNPGDLEKAMVRKGMTKAEAGKNKGMYMDN